MKKAILALTLALIFFAGLLALLDLWRRVPRSDGVTSRKGAVVRGEDAGKAPVNEDPPSGRPLSAESIASPSPGVVESGTPRRAGGPLPFLPGNASVQFALERARGGPLAGATVTLLRGRKARSVVCAADGGAAFEQIEAGVYSFSITSPGLPGLVSARELTLLERETKRLRIVVGDYAQSIAGRLQDPSGSPLEGIEVTARRWTAALQEGDVVREDQEILSSRSDRAGRYEIGGVDRGDYVVRTVPSGGFSEAFKVVRGGSRSVNFVLGAGRKIEVQGKVLTRSGEAVAGAVVVSLGEDAPESESDASGHYAVEVDFVAEQTVAVLVARKAGFREARVNLRLSDVGEVDSWQMDLVVDELGAQTTVTGTVRGADRTPLSGQRLMLRSGSLNTQYEGASDASGHFAIEGVQVGGDYTLTIYPPVGFKDFSQSPIEVEENGAALDITLEPLERGPLEGILVDVSGAPVPDFTLWVRSLQAQASSVAVSSDARGAFMAREVPEGDLLFETRSEPRITLRGFRHDPAAPVPLRLVIDWGAYQVEGVVLDEMGVLLPGVAVSMAWAQSVESVQTSSYRTCVTDASGRFSFSELGPGPRKITVTTPGSLPAQVSVDPATDPLPLSIQLKAKPARPASPRE